MSRRQRRQLISAIILLISALVTLATQKGWLQQPAQQVSQLQPGLYRVTTFYDGDTIAVDMQGTTEKVRMIGVDTPETHHPSKPVQCFGEAASSYTKKLIGSNAVRLEADSTNSNRDRYGRLLRYVYLPDGRLVDAEIIKNGYGFAYTSFPFTKMEEFRGYEREAREANRGLWASCQATETNGAQSTNPAN